MEMLARSVAAFRVAIRLASAPIIRCCAAVGGSDALRMRHTPCGCRSAHLVEVRSNSRLPPVSTMRRAKQCRYFARSLPPSKRHSRLTTVRRGCCQVATRRDSWRSHVHRTQFRRPRSSSSYNLPMQNFSRGIERGILSFEREYPPFIRAVPSALLFPIHAQREKPPLICKDKKTTPRCCEFLRSSIPLRRASRAPPLRGHQ